MKIKKVGMLMLIVLTITICFSIPNCVNAAITAPVVEIDKRAEWTDIENGIAKITLTQKETVGQETDSSDYLIVFDVSGSMPIVTVNGYGPGTHNIDVGEAVNIGCRNPNHYSKLKPGQAADMEGYRNCYHYSNNGTPSNTSDDILLNYDATTYKQLNWKGDVVQTFNLSGVKNFMYSKAKGCYSSMDVAQEMINKFVDETLKIDSGAKFAYIAFAGSVVKTNGFTTGANLKNIVNTSTQYVGTQYLPPIQKAKEILASYTGSKPLKVLFITDGDNTDTDKASQILSEANSIKSTYGAQIYSVTIDYNPSSSASVRAIADRFISLTSSNINNAVSQFVDYSLNKRSIRVQNKTYEDVVNSSNFELLTSAPYALPANMTSSGNTVTWQIPENTDTNNKTYTASFYVKLKDEYRKNATDTKYKTNLDTSTAKGATMTYSFSGGNNRTLTKNSPELPYGLKVINATKEWDDYNNNFNTRPENTTFSLLKDGSIVDSITSSSNTKTFPGYKYDNGKLVVYGLLYNNSSSKVNNTYLVNETKVTDYDIVSNGNSSNNYTVTNKLNKTSTLQVNYVDNYGNVLLPQENYTDQVGTEYTTTRKTKYGYRAHGEDPSNATGVYTTSPTVVTYVYEKTPADLTVNYIDKYSDDILDSKVIKGYVGDQVTTSSKDFEGYVLDESPDVEEYELVEDEQIVNYYYIKQSKVKTKYIDENTGKEIADSVEYIYNEKSPYLTPQKTIEGYSLTGDTGNTTGTVEREDIEVIYYYKKNTSVIVRYLDINNNDELHDEILIPGLEADDYETEEKSFDGYQFITVDGVPKGKMGPEPITITYYYSKQSKVITRFLDENTGEVLADQVEDIYKENDEYTTNAKTIIGYTVTKDTGNTTGTVKREDIEVTYYYKKLTRLIVKYVDMYTGEEISDKIDRVALQNDRYSTQVRDISGYRYKEVEGEVAGIMPADPVTVTYKYAKLSRVFVEYYDENTGLKIAPDEEPVKYEEKENYTTSSKEIDGYKLVGDNGKTEGIVEREDIYVRYYYKKNTSVTVKYIDMVTNEEIADTEKIEGVENQEFTTEKKVIPGYEFIESIGKTSGQMDRDPQEVIYKYKKQANLITEHIDANTNEKIIDDVIKTYKEGDNYEALGQYFEGYIMVEEPAEKTGIMGREDITKTFYYKKISAGLIVKYVDVITGELLDQEVYEGNENDNVNLDEKQFIHYVLHSRPDFTSVDLTVEPQEVTFYYIRESKVPVEGIDQDTREVLYTTEISGIEGEEYTTIPRNLDEYTLVKIPDNQNGTFKRENEKVIYEYKKNKGKVLVKYIDKDTKEELGTEEIIGIYGENYQTEQKKFESYNFDSVIGPVVGKIEEGIKEVTYYYTRKTGKLIVKYVDEKGKELLREESEDRVGELYKVEEKEIKNYEVIQRPDSLEGEYVEGTTVLVFVLKKNSDVKDESVGTIIVNFIDKDGNKLAESVMDRNEVGEKFYLEAPEINGYKIVGDAIVETEFIEGELVFDIVYEKIEEPNIIEDVLTGDINMILVIVTLVASISGIVIVKIKNKKEA